MAALSPIIVARFWSKVLVKPSELDCWEWSGAVGAKGYGNFKVGRENVGAHRVAYALYNGNFLEAGLVTRHKCDNPKCCNPMHLEPGTPADNSQDMVDRGRSKGQDQRGSLNHAAKLNEQSVAAIRERIARGENNVRIARDFKVSHATISLIRRGLIWREVA